MARLWLAGNGSRNRELRRGRERLYQVNRECLIAERYELIQERIDCIRKRM